jgi:hypothetical protein
MVSSMRALKSVPVLLVRYNYERSETILVEAEVEKGDSGVMVGLEVVLVFDLG